MGQVMIECVNTGKPLSTGIEMDKDSFENAGLSENWVDCPHCGDSHNWSKSDAWLEG
jgi:hypothetical protein